jgi:hypothetical protein
VRRGETGEEEESLAKEDTEGKIQRESDRGEKTEGKRHTERHRGSDME